MITVLVLALIYLFLCLSPPLALSLSHPLSLYSQIHMHGGSFADSLCDHFHSTILPPEFGGEGPAIEEVCQEWTNHILRSEELLAQLSAHPAEEMVAPEDRQSAT